MRPGVLTGCCCVNFLTTGFRKCLIPSAPGESGSIQGGVRVEVCGTDDKATIIIEIRDGNDSQGPTTESRFKSPENIMQPLFPQDLESSWET